MIKQYSFCVLYKAKVLVAQKYKCKLHFKKKKKFNMLWDKSKT